MIKVQNISFTYGGSLIYDGASLTVGDSQIVGLVGVNGAGKSTLFRILTGSEDVSAGSIKILGSIGYVPQEVKSDPPLKEAKTIREYLDPQNTLPEHEMSRLLFGLELGKLNLDTKPEKMSGGQKTKLALARALISEPDILFLDEPTNFMDVAGKQFVMNFLADYKKTVICISHDLELMDSAIDKVFEVNKDTRKIDEYKGNYSDYRRLKKESEEHLKRQVLIKQKHIKQMEKSLIKLYGQKSKKGVKQRVIHQRKIEKEKEALPDMPKEAKSFQLNLPEPTRVAELPLKAVNISKSFGEKIVLDDLNFSLRRGEKVVLIGKNGAGKSTFIKILLEEMKPDTGYVVRADNATVGYYSQEFDNFDFDSRVLSFVQAMGKVHEQRARSFLGRFMFDEAKVRQTIGSLSGGEKTRLSIALLMLQNSNVLVLDEPTTYLDTMSQRVILESLKEYKGTLILVSHVEEFVKEIKPDRAILLPEGRVKLWDDELLGQISLIE